MANKLSRDDIDRFFDYGIDISSKTLYIGSWGDDYEGNENGVDYQMAKNALKGLQVLDSIKKEEPLTIIMNNTGGDWYHGMSIFDGIKACKSHVKIIVYGHAMSMGSVILQAADERIMTPNSRLMIHYGYEGGPNTYKNVQRWAEEGKKVAKDMEDIYLEKIKQKLPNFTRAKLKNMLDPDTILNAQETVELGLADSILGEDYE